MNTIDWLPCKPLWVAGRSAFRQRRTLQEGAAAWSNQFFSLVGHRHWRRDEHLVPGEAAASPVEAGFIGIPTRSI